MRSYLNSRTVATAIGAIATAGAIALLVADGIQMGRWTAEHAFVPLVVCITVACGHLSFSALRAWRPIAAAGFGLAFVLGTSVTFSNGIGRLTEASELKASDARKANDAISAKRTEIAETRARLDTAQANVERETKGGGCKAICKDWKARVSELQSHAAILQVQLDKLGGTRPVNAKAQRMGELAGLLGFDGAHVAQVFGLVEPLLLPLLLELTGIAGFGFGLGHQTAAKVAMELPTPPGRKSRRGVKERDRKVVAFVDRYRAAHGRDPSIPDMLAAFPGMPTSTAQRYRKAGGNVVALPPLRVATA